MTIGFQGPLSVELLGISSNFLPSTIKLPNAILPADVAYPALSAYSECDALVADVADVADVAVPAASAYSE